ncbi:MAG: pentapeptide repeat-containing protein [Nostoc sp.]
MEKTNLTNANIQGVNLMGVDLEDAIRPEGFTIQ